MSIRERDFTREVSVLKPALRETVKEHHSETTLLVCLRLEGEAPEETLREAREAQEATQRLIEKLIELERHVHGRLAEARVTKKTAEDLEENVLDIYPELRQDEEVDERAFGVTTGQVEA